MITYSDLPEDIRGYCDSLTLSYKKSGRIIESEYRWIALCNLGLHNTILNISTWSHIKLLSKYRHESVKLDYLNATEKIYYNYVCFRLGIDI